jgi:hypothetical protein
MLNEKFIEHRVEYLMISAGENKKGKALPYLPFNRHKLLQFI